jgi:hypothetical protein
MFMNSKNQVHFSGFLHWDILRLKLRSCLLPSLLILFTLHSLEKITLK